MIVRPFALPATAAFLAVTALPAFAAEPLHVLLVAGGCCHDYPAQSKILRDGIQARANVQVDVVLSKDSSTSPRFPMYQSADWAKGYDLVIHDECAADVTERDYVANILNAHKTVPAVNLHCAMHSYRWGNFGEPVKRGADNARWYEFLGLQSTGHGAQIPIALDFVNKQHPVTQGMANWTTIKEELYNNRSLLDQEPLIVGTQDYGNGKVEKTIVAWTNEKFGARSFTTSLGHNNETVADARYLDLVTRGLLWSANKLNADYLTPYKGPEGKFTLIEKQAPPPKVPKAGGGPAVKVTASSTQGGNDEINVLDGEAETRWCADGGSVPQWLQLELPQAEKLTGIDILWEQADTIYFHKVEGSADGKAWKVLADATNTKDKGRNQHTFTADGIRFVRINVEKTSAGGAAWVSIREVVLKGPNLKGFTAIGKDGKSGVDAFAKEGNVPPAIEAVTPEREAQILKDVKVPEGFDLTLFASPPAANYPVYVAAAPNGDLYVSSDGNGSLGRKPHRGRILRLRDTNGDGRADQVTEFVKDLDSPRGLVWDHDRLYVIHPADVSVFIDKDGDGVSDETKTLVKGIAFGFADRPADHTTNGLSIGIDGWLYIAGGDFGFMDAVGTDGRHLQHRGGGVIRFRPDGSGLELYADGTRNILEVAVGPTMQMFSRDNTNDGGGWDVRFHSFTGGENHGYPRLYKNFDDEIIKPLADYGGGSGCGAVYLDEPGFPEEWNHAPMSCDWGTGALWKHTVKAKGATFEETEKPKPFIKMTRPTDADVDALSHVYQASWKGATFDWEGGNVGYIVRVTPTGYKPEALPDFDKLSDGDLVKLLETPSHRRRLEAERTLMRRGLSDATLASLKTLAADTTKPIATRTAALFAALSDQKAARALLDSLNPPASDGEFAVVYARFAAEVATLYGPSASLPKAFAVHASPAFLVQAVRTIAACPGWSPAAVKSVLAKTLGESDFVVQQTAYNALGKLKASAIGFELLDASTDPAFRQGALRGLRQIHDPAVVKGLADRLARANDPQVRKGLISALARLHFLDGTWKGDSWGTRPDTRGPYYQPEAWAGSEQVAAALKDALSKSSGEETSFIVSEMSRNRMKSDEALERIVAMAAQDPAKAAVAVGQLAAADTIPAAGIPVLIAAATAPGSSPEVLSQAVVALSKTDSVPGLTAALSALGALDKAKGSGKEQDAARQAFLAAPKLDLAAAAFETTASAVTGGPSSWADAALLTISARKNASPENLAAATKALEAGWSQPKRRVQILKAVQMVKHAPYADKVLAALDDPDPEVAKAADTVAKALKFEKKTGKEPMTATMKPDDVIAQVLKTKGDAALGEQLFTRQGCVACHTTNQSQAQKGPYLGNIAQTYKRQELAQNILDPNKTIAQGFNTEMFTLKDGKSLMGFVTFESADQVKLRDIAATENTIAVKDIAKRERLPNSMMPPGLVASLTVREFASLLDYLEALSKK